MSNEVFESAPESRVREWIDSYCEKGILGLFLAILIVGTLAIGGVRPSEFALIQGLTVGMLGLWAVRLWANRHFRLLWPPICWAVLAFIAYALIRCRWVEVEYPARLELNRVLVYGTIFFTLVNNVSRRNTTTLICMVLIVLGTLLSIFAIYQAATHYPKIFSFIKPRSYLNRGSGTFINPNHLAGFLAMLVPISLAYAIMGRFKPTAKVLFSYISLLLIAGIGVSFSRGGIIAAAVAITFFLIFLVFQRDYWLRSLAMLACIGVAAIFFARDAALLKQRFEPGMSSFGDEQDGRLAYWGIANRLFHDNVLWGIGPAHFNCEFWRQSPSNMLAIPEYAHNEYLQTLCEWGAVGMAIIAATLALLVLGILKTWPHVRRDPNELGGKNSTKAAFLLGAAFGLLAVVFHVLVDFDMHIPINAIVVIALIALISNQLRFATEGYWANPGIVGKCLITILLLTGAYYLGNQAWQINREHTLINQAADAPANSPEKIALLKRAAQLEPTNPDPPYAIGECFFFQTQRGDSDYKTYGLEALSWYSRAMQLNPYFPFSPLRYGMCLDWLDRSQESAPYYNRALNLYPQSAMIPAYQGWHYMQMEDYATAQTCLELSMKRRGSPLAQAWLQKVNKLQADASAKAPIPASAH